MGCPVTGGGDCFGQHCVEAQRWLPGVVPQLHDEHPACTQCIPLRQQMGVLQGVAQLLCLKQLH